MESHNFSNSNDIILFDDEDCSTTRNVDRGDVNNGSCFDRKLLIQTLQDLKINARDITNYFELKRCKEEIKEIQEILNEFDGNEIDPTVSI